MFPLLKQNQKSLCVIWDTSGFLSSPRRRCLGDWSGRWGCSVISWSGGFYLVLRHCWSCLLSFSFFFSCWLEADPTVISTIPSSQHLRVSKPLTSVCRFPSPQFLFGDTILKFALSCLFQHWGFITASHKLHVIYSLLTYIMEKCCCWLYRKKDWVIHNRSHVKKISAVGFREKNYVCLPDFWLLPCFWEQSPPVCSSTVPSAVLTWSHSQQVAIREKGN